MKRYLPGVLAIAAPLGVGLLASLLFQRGILPEHLLVGSYVIGYSGLASVIGIVLSLLAAIFVGMLWWAQAQIDSVYVSEQEQQAQNRRRFLRRLDHELKNPLTTIRLGIVNLQQSPGLDSDQTASLERVGLQVQRLQRLVMDLRWLAELEERGIERTPVDLAEVLTDVVAMMQDTPDYNHRPVDLNIQQVPWPVASVSGDRDLLVVAFRNLVDNALKYTADGDQVEVRATDDGQTAIVEIADTGPGIPDGEMPHIFEELYRGDNARGISGSGLGLALVQRIIHLHGGSIRVRSRVGQGTVMSVHLPLAPES